MRLISYLIIGLTLIIPYANAAPPTPPNPAQVSASEITAGTETELRSYSPADVKSFIDTHGGADAYTVKVDAAATAAYLYNAGSGAVRAGTNVTIDDDGDYITINASLAGGAVDTEGTLNADEIAVMHDLDTIKSLTEAEFKAAYNMEAGTDYLAPNGDGGSVTNLNGENIQDDTIDDDSLDFGDITLDDFINADGDHISVASDDIFDFTRNDSGTVTITSSDDDANAALTVVAGGTGALTLGGASNTSITATTDGGSITLDGLIAIGTDPADAGVIRLENATAIAWEDATEATITHVDNTGFIINLGLEIDGTLNADGIVALGDGGDNFSIASDGIDIDTSGNITNAGTIGCGKVTSSAAFESATGLFDVTGAAAITVGSADVTAITFQTDDTGDGTDLVLPAQSVNGSEMLNNTVTATQLSATLTFADGDVIDLSGITHTGSTDEGLALPTWANVTPTSDKAWAAWDGTNQILKIYDGGWVSISPSGAPTDATYLTLSVDATLSDERVLTESTQGIDFTDGGAGSTLTVSLDTTEVDATTWSDGANASNVWTFDVSGTDHTMTAGNGLMTFGDAVTVTDTLTANNGIDLGTSNSISGTTAMTFGAGTETIAINTSDWDIDATGVMTNMGNITSDGVVTATGFTIGSAAITETELEILDGATLSTTQINYLNAATGTTGTTNTNVVFSASPTLTGTAVVTNIDGSGTISGNLFTPDAADGADIGSTSLEFSDIYVADGSVIYFGNDQDVTLTHVADTELTLSADLGMLDDQVIEFGTSDDTTLGYDETTDDRLEISTTLSAATGDEEALALIYTTNKATSGNDTGLLIAMTDTASPGTSYLIDLQVDGSSVWNVDETGKVSIPQGFDDPYIFLNVATSGDTDWYITVDDEQGADDDDSLKFSTTGQNDSTPELEVQTDGDVIAEGTVTGTSLIMEGGTYDTTFDPGTPTASVTYQWPLDDGGSGEVLSTNGSGTLSWTAVTATAAGSNTGEIQIRAGDGSLGSDGTAFLYNATNNTLNITQASSNPTITSGDGSYSWNHTPQVGIEGVLEVDGIASFDGGIDVNEDIDIDLDAADEEINIAQSAVAGTEDIPLIAINDDRTGATATELSEASIWLDSEGVYAIAAIDGAIAAEGGFFPTASDGAALGSVTLEFSDIFIADAGVINLGDDQDVTITHVADTGILINAAMQIQLRDSAIHIESADDGHLDLTADTSIDLNGAVIATSTIAATGAVSGNNVNPDAADGATLGTTALEWSDIYVADSGIIYLGNDQDVLITHVADTGLNITTTANTSGTINLGNDDDVNDDSIDLILHDSGIITLYDANDDASASLSVADGASDFTMSGGLVLGGTLDLGAAALIDATGAVDIDIGSVDITDVTIVTDGGTVTIDGTTITAAAADDPYVVFDPSTASESEWWIGVNHDSVGDDNDSMEIRQSATPGTNVEFEIEPDADIIIGSGADADTTITIDNDDTDGVIQRMADEKTWKLNNIIAVTPQTYDASDAADTDITVGTEITSSIVFVTGDNDSDNDEVDLQNGNVDGQMIIFIAGTNIDADDTITIDTTTDSTCTGCTSVVLDEPGDSFQCNWVSSSWNCYQLNEVP